MQNLNCPNRSLPAKSVVVYPTNPPRIDPLSAWQVNYLPILLVNASQEVTAETEVFARRGTAVLPLVEMLDHRKRIIHFSILKVRNIAVILLQLLLLVIAMYDNAYADASAWALSSVPSISFRTGLMNEPLIAITDQRSLMAVRSTANYISVFDTKSGELKTVLFLSDSLNSPLSISWSSDGKCLVALYSVAGSSNSNANYLATYYVDDLTLTKLFLVPSSSRVRCMSGTRALLFQVDHSALPRRNDCDSLFVVNYPSGELLRRIVDNDTSYIDLAAYRNGILATLSTSGRLCIRDSADGSLISSSYIGSDDNRITSMEISLDAQHIVLRRFANQSGENGLFVYNVKDRSTIAIPTPLSNTLTACISDDGSTLALSERRDEVSLYSVETHTIVGKVKYPGAGLLDVAVFRSLKKGLVVQNRDGVISATGDQYTSPFQYLTLPYHLIVRMQQVAAYNYSIVQYSREIAFIDNEKHSIMSVKQTDISPQFAVCQNYIVYQPSSKRLVALSKQDPRLEFTSMNLDEPIVAFDTKGDSDSLVCVGESGNVYQLSIASAFFDKRGTVDSNVAGCKYLIGANTLLLLRYVENDSVVEVGTGRLYEYSTLLDLGAPKGLSKVFCQLRTHASSQKYLIPQLAVNRTTGAACGLNPDRHFIAYDSESQEVIVDEYISNVTSSIDYYTNNLVVIADYDLSLPLRWLDLSRKRFVAFKSIKYGGISSIPRVGIVSIATAPNTVIVGTNERQFIHQSLDGVVSSEAASNDEDRVTLSLSVRANIVRIESQDERLSSTIEFYDILGSRLRSDQINAFEHVLPDAHGLVLVKLQVNGQVYHDKLFLWSPN